MQSGNETSLMLMGHFPVKNENLSICLSMAQTEWLPVCGCRGSVAEHWQVKPEVSWVRLPAS